MDAWPHQKREILGTCGKYYKILQLFICVSNVFSYLNGKTNFLSGETSRAGTMILVISYDDDAGDDEENVYDR